MNKRIVRIVFYLFTIVFFIAPPLFVLCHWASEGFLVHSPVYVTTNPQNMNGPTTDWIVNQLQQNLAEYERVIRQQNDIMQSGLIVLDFAVVGIAILLSTIIILKDYHVEARKK